MFVWLFFAWCLYACAIGVHIRVCLLACFVVVYVFGCLVVCVYACVSVVV